MPHQPSPPLPLHNRCPYRLGSCGTGLPGPKPRSRRCSLGTKTCVFIIIFLFIVIFFPIVILIPQRALYYHLSCLNVPGFHSSYKPHDTQSTSIMIIREAFCIIYHFHGFKCTWFPQLLHATGHPVNIHPGFLVHSPIRAHVAQYLENSPMYTRVFHKLHFAKKKMQYQYAPLTGVYKPDMKEFFS